MLHHINIHIGIKLIQVPLKIRITHFVAIFELAEVLSLLLDRVVCEVDKLIIKIIKIKLLGTCPDIAIFIKVPFECFVNACYEGEDAEIEFAAVNQKRIVNILLHNKSFLISNCIGATG